MNTFLDVRYEDNHLLAINKPCGMLVQGDETGDVPLVEICKSYIKKKFDKPGEVFLGVVHRLDRPVSGVVVFARTSKALARMNELFRSRETEKIYWAISDRKPSSPAGTLVHWLKKDEKKNFTTAYTRETPEALRSELSYSLMQQQHGLYLIEVRPKTGRSHQIRVQLASLGCPILGDRKYGSTYVANENSIALHARQLEFIHPVRKEAISIEAPVPQEEWWKYFNSK